MEEYDEHTVWRHLRENAEGIINSEWDCDILKHQQSIFLETACKQHESHKIKRKIKLKSGYRNASCKENRTVFSVTSFPVSFTYNKHERLDLREATHKEKQNKTKQPKSKKPNAMCILRPPQMNVLGHFDFSAKCCSIHCEQECYTSSGSS